MHRWSVHDALYGQRGLSGLRRKSGMHVAFGLERVRAVRAEGIRILYRRMRRASALCRSKPRADVHGRRVPRGRLSTGRRRPNG